jgi:hypothetical protein
MLGRIFFAQTRAKILNSPHAEVSFSIESQFSLKPSMIRKTRHDKLTSQHIEVALVYKEMLGPEEAKSYLEREQIASDVVERILHTDKRRQAPPAPAPVTLPPAPPFACRRRNRVHDAIVEAALKIERKLGEERARELLKAEDVPDAVAARILAQGPRQIRAKRAAR